MAVAYDQLNTHHLIYRIAIIVLSIVLFLTASFVNAQERRLDRFTICLERDTTKLTVSGESLHFFDDELGLLVYQIEGRHEHVITASSEGISVDSKVIDTSRLRIRSTQNWLSYKDKIFREDMIVIRLPDNPGRIALANEIQLESYLYGLINKEALASWPIEAKKAQAVAARTYALHKRINHPKEICDLDSTALDQVYGGYNVEDSAAREAVDSTRGEVLTYHNQIAKTYYHSTSGGKTASSSSIWGDPQPYLVSLTDPYGDDSPTHHWSVSYSKNDFAKKLSVPSNYRNDFFFDIVGRDESGRVKKARLKYGKTTRYFSGEEVRKLLGYANLKSSLFSFRIAGGKVVINGKGFGHGVGMSQWGAAGMSKRGSSYQQIVQFYYPGTKIRRLY